MESTFNATERNEHGDTEYWTFKRVEFVFAVAYVPMVIIGVVGNSLIIKIMPNRGTNMTSTGVLFSILAVIDMYVICLGPLRSALNLFFSYESLDTAVKSMLFEWGIVCGLDMSTWSLVIITTERLFSVLFPLKVKLMFTVKGAVVMEIVALVILAALHAVRIFGLTYQYYFDYFQAYIILPRIKNGVLYYHWSEFVLTYAAPLLVFCIGSIIISLKIRRLKGGTAQHSARVMSITRNLIGANVTFIVTNTPFRAFNLIYNARLLDNLSSVQLMALVNACIYFQFLSQVMNFYVYVLSGQSFRQDTIRLFCGKMFEKRTFMNSIKKKDNKHKTHRN